MVALAAANVTWVYLDKKIMPKEKHYFGTLAFGNGVLTYPLGGVPLPAASFFGMERFLLKMFLSNPDNEGIMWDFLPAVAPPIGVAQASVGFLKAWVTGAALSGVFAEAAAALTPTASMNVLMVGW